jgi:integrase
MSIYLVKGKGYRYDFTMKGERYTDTWFKTKKAAQAAEAKRREELRNPKPELEVESKAAEEQTQTGITFLELVNLRLDHVLAYNSKGHYEQYVYMARRWVKAWGELKCSQISQILVEKFILERRRLSPATANREIRYLRATFNFGKKKKIILENPLDGLEFLPVEKSFRHTPSPEEVDKVIAAADPETQDYLWAIRESLGRMGEINRLTWNDVDLKERYVILYTRKKKGGHLTPRRVPMTQMLLEILTRRFETRDPSKNWVFWHTYRSSKTGELKEGPYQDRKKFMRTLCKKAGIKYFRFHALRHSGASLMDACNVPIGSIQRILGHESRTTTEIYLHSIGESERDAMAVFERARQKSHTNSHTKTEGATVH